MSRRSYTSADKVRADRLRELGCIVCINENACYTPPAIHHIDGQTKEGCHQNTIPLCAYHHQYKSNETEWISRHGDGRRAFEDAYGLESELLEITNRLINEN